MRTNININQAKTVIGGIKIMIGRVVSIKNQNTANVLVERAAVNKLYGKTYKRSKKYLIDDSIGVKMGDMVEIINCKPISKGKTMKIVKVLGRNLAEIMKEKLKASAEAAISEVMPEKLEEKEVASDKSLELSEKEKEGGSKEVKSQKSKVKSTDKK